MRKSRFTEAQIVAILREFDAGAPADKLARRYGIHADNPSVALEICWYERQRSR